MGKIECYKRINQHNFNCKSTTHESMYNNMVQD
jgi:hypothetical protein